MVQPAIDCFEKILVRGIVCWGIEKMANCHWAAAADRTSTEQYPQTNGRRGALRHGDV